MNADNTALCPLGGTPASHLVSAPPAQSDQGPRDASYRAVSHPVSQTVMNQFPPTQVRAEASIRTTTQTRLLLPQPSRQSPGEQVPGCGDLQGARPPGQPHSPGDVHTGPSRIGVQASGPGKAMRAELWEQSCELCVAWSGLRQEGPRDCGLLREPGLVHLDENQSHEKKAPGPVGAGPPGQRTDRSCCA